MYQLLILMLYAPVNVVNRQNVEVLFYLVSFLVSSNIFMAKRLLKNLTISCEFSLKIRQNPSCIKALSIGLDKQKFSA